jgi:hypothetical protein
LALLTTFSSNPWKLRRLVSSRQMCRTSSSTGTEVMLSVTSQVFIKFWNNFCFIMLIEISQGFKTYCSSFKSFIGKTISKLYIISWRTLCGKIRFQKYYFEIIKTYASLLQRSVSKMNLLNKACITKNVF